MRSLAFDSRGQPPVLDIPIEFFPEPHRAWLKERERVDARGIAHLVEKPEEILVMVCGGLGNLHAMGLHNFGPTRAVTKGF